MKLEQFCVHAPQATVTALRGCIALLFGPIIAATASQEPLLSLGYLAAGAALWSAIRSH